MKLVFTSPLHTYLIYTINSFLIDTSVVSSMYTEKKGDWRTLERIGLKIVSPRAWITSCTTCSEVYCALPPTLISFRYVAPRDFPTSKMGTKLVVWAISL